MDSELERQIRHNFEQLATDPAFALDRVWLTFYLQGDPADLGALAEQLERQGWSNLDGSEGGFLYPKRALSNAAEVLIECAVATRAFCERRSIEILAIDADTSPEPGRSRFRTLFRSPNR